eukprot:jgi/Chrpa1/23557/Chrysochromulina_OHIO_Genome00028040-RA
MPPENRRRFAVSHGWACENHPTPSGERIKKLEKALEFDGVVCLIKLSANVDENMVRAVLGGFGIIKSCDLKRTPPIVRFASHASAVAAKNAGAWPGLCEGLEIARADDDDAVFLDYASLFQDARFGTGLGLPPQRIRTPDEDKCFRTALFEISRMFAFGGVKVIVLPQLELLRDFPAVLSSQSAPVLKFSEVKKRKCERSYPWGWINAVPYENRGWCAAEFSCALKAGIIANLEDPDVQRVCKARKWPNTVKEYQKMMDDPAIEFTDKGDNDKVAYLFFKMSFDLSATQHGQPSGADGP